MGATRSYQLVLARIEADLASGRVQLGGRLPGERVLAEQYGVSRASVREAIRVLEAMGLIRTAAGSGPEAGAVLISEPAAPIGAALRWHLASRFLPVADLVGARVLIESWAVREAASRQPGDPRRLDGARDLLTAMDDHGLSVTEFLALDTRFHVALAELGGNAVVAAMMSAMREGIESYVNAAVAELADWPSMASSLRIQHAGILEAVALGRADEAASLVAGHITGFYRATGIGQRREGSGIDGPAGPDGPVTTTQE